MTGICNSFCMTRRIEMQLASLSETLRLSLICKALSISMLMKQKRTTRWNAWSCLVIWLRLPCNLRQVSVWSASSCSAWWMELEIKGMQAALELLSWEAYFYHNINRCYACQLTSWGETGRSCWCLLRQETFAYKMFYLSLCMTKRMCMLWNVCLQLVI